MGRTPGIIAFLGALCFWTTLPASSYAHRLEADYRILADKKVQIEAWFDITGDSARGARVQVTGASGQVVASGKTNEQGVFLFSFNRPETLRIAIDAGAGHRKDLAIPESELTSRQNGADSSSTTIETSSQTPLPFADRSPRVGLKEILEGIGFILALAAFILSWRNARVLRALTKKDAEPFHKK